MYRLFLLSLLLLCFMRLSADEARLMRFPAISSNQIDFTYAGNLYTVSSEGGIARKLTSHEGLGLGTLVGTRTWGGIVGITGSLPFIDGTDLRIPQFTSLSMDGQWMIEGHGVEPDIEV